MTFVPASMKWPESVVCMANIEEF